MSLTVIEGRISSSLFHSSHWLLCLRIHGCVFRPLARTPVVLPSLGTADRRRAWCRCRVLACWLAPDSVLTTVDLFRLLGSRSYLVVRCDRCILSLNWILYRFLKTGVKVEIQLSRSLIMCANHNTKIHKDIISRQNWLLKHYTSILDSWLAEWCFPFAVFSIRTPTSHCW
jgi:hypothetical protein